MTSEEREAAVARFFDPDDGPDPVVCPYCGRALWREAVRDSEGTFAYWDPTEPECGCEGERKARDARRLAADEESRAFRERQGDMRFAGMARACLAPGSLPARMAGRTFAAYDPATPAQERAKDVASRYAERFGTAEDSGKGLYLWGPYGTGKTHLAMAVCARLRELGVRRVLARTVTEMLADVRACYQPGGGSEEDVLGLYKSARLLVLDDLGKEKCTEWGMNTLYEVLNTRCSLGRPTIATSNFAMDELAAAATGINADRAGAISDRLRGSMIGVRLDGPSHRARRPA